MSSRAMYIPAADKVAMRIGNRRILATFDDAAELLAELQVIFDERQLHWGEESPGDEDER